MQTRGQGNDTFKVLKDKMCQEKFYNQQNYLSKMEKYRFSQGWWYSSMAQCLPNMFKAQGLISSTTKNKHNKK
jgi:hypothetical protein